MALNVSARDLTFIEFVLAALGTIGGYLVANAASLSTTHTGLLSITGAIVGYAAADLLTFVETGAPPATGTVQSQAVAAIKAALALPNLTAAQTQALQLALTVAEYTPVPAA